jgi:hypothetical protein
MKHPHSSPISCSSPLPAAFLARLAEFSDLFTRPTWANVVLLVTGAVLAPGRRVVTAALRILGLDQEPNFPIYHAVLSKARWSSRAVAGRGSRMLMIARELIRNRCRVIPTPLGRGFFLPS